MEHHIPEHIRSTRVRPVVRAAHEHDFLHMHSNGQNIVATRCQYGYSTKRLLYNNHAICKRQW